MTSRAQGERVSTDVRDLKSRAEKGKEGESGDEIIIQDGLDVKPCSRADPSFMGCGVIA